MDMTFYCQKTSEQEALDILNPYRELINEKIPLLLNIYVKDLYFLQILEEHFRVANANATVSHSKRLRGVLCMIIAESLGISLDSVISFSCSLEFFHAASLTIDDIQDNTEERAGKKAIWKQIGKNDSINVGFFFKDTGLRIFNNSTINFPKAVLNINDFIHNISQEMAIGQSMDLRAISSWSLGLSHYYEIVQRKTGCLIGLSLCLPFLLMGKPKEAQIIYEFGKLLGVIHQLNDDFDDFRKLLLLRNEDYPPTLDTGNIVYFLDTSLYDDFHLEKCGQISSNLQNIIYQNYQHLFEKLYKLPLSYDKYFDKLIGLCNFMVKRNATDLNLFTSIRL